MHRMKRALQIGDDHKFGEAFDAELKEQKRKAKIEEREMRKIEELKKKEELKK